MIEYGTMAGRYPAIVKSYDQTSRTCRVEIPALTNGAEVYPVAEIEYPIGDKSRSGENSTELEINSGDAVWVAFINGDSRYPIITGYRNPYSGNSADWRRYHHENMECLTETAYRVESGDTVEIKAGSSITLTVGGVSIVIDGSSIVQTATSITNEAGQISLNGAISGGGSGGATATFKGDIISEKDVVASGISLATHTHTGDSGGTTSTPK